MRTKGITTASIGDVMRQVGELDVQPGSGQESQSET